MKGRGSEALQSDGENLAGATREEYTKKCLSLHVGFPMSEFATREPSPCSAARCRTRHFCTLSLIRATTGLVRWARETTFKMDAETDSASESGGPQRFDICGGRGGW